MRACAHWQTSAGFGGTQFFAVKDLGRQ